MGMSARHFLTVTACITAIWSGLLRVEASPLWVRRLTSMLLPRSLFRQYSLEDKAEVVKLPAGELRGRQENTRSGKRYFAFEGIPYAKPPVGDLRFKDPQRLKPWEGVHEACSVGPACPQKSYFADDVAGSEDCLYLNVYTPKVGDTLSPLPVIVWIHGGTFRRGRGDDYRPDFLIDQGVVFVSMNYRLGTLGFLSTGDSVIPGNMGLKDQTMALRWVKENIAGLGGDPSRVTVAGQSAGAACVNLHMLSPLSEGLISGAISMSGTALSPWSLARDPQETARQLVLALGASNDTAEDSRAMAKFLSEVPYEQLVLREEDAYGKGPLKAVKGMLPPFVPTVEPPGRGAFLSERPEKLLKKGAFQRIPYLAGFVSAEAKLYVAELLQSGAETGVEMANRMIEPIVGVNLRVEGIQKQMKAAAELKRYYLGDGVITSKQLTNFTELLSDLFFVEPGLTTLKVMSDKSRAPVFNYEFSYEGHLKWLRGNDGKLPVRGVSHSEDLPYVFPTVTEDPNIDENDGRTRLVFTTIIANFVKDGHPLRRKTPLLWVDWPPFTSENPIYLDIGCQLRLKRDLHGVDLSFWKTLLTPLN